MIQYYRITRKSIEKKKKTDHMRMVKSMLRSKPHESLRKEVKREVADTRRINKRAFCNYIH